MYVLQWSVYLDACCFVLFFSRSPMRKNIEKKENTITYFPLIVKKSKELQDLDYKLKLSLSLLSLCACVCVFKKILKLQQQFQQYTP